MGARWFRQAGGMPPLSLGPVSGRYLSYGEREEIAIFGAQGVGVREIGRRLGRCASTITRELRRNAATRNRDVVYRATTAQWHADRRACRPKVSKLAANDELRRYVQDRLGWMIAHPGGEVVRGPEVKWTGRRHGRRVDRRWVKSWSPEQISNRLRIEFPHNESMRISHEAIYQAAYVQGRGALQWELVACLGTGRALRVPRVRTRKRGRNFVTPEIMITQRPAEADDRAVPGHWEGDLILGLRSSAIGTLVERTTVHDAVAPPTNARPPRRKGMHNGPARPWRPGRTRRYSVVDHDAAPIAPPLADLGSGAEMAQHGELRVDTDFDVYFCDPHSPWQRGTNENTNGLLRQYFPKGTDLYRHSPSDLDAVAAALNGRPRKTLGWRTPAEALTEHLHSLKQGTVATTP